MSERNHPGAMWALLVAMPLAYSASGSYFDFFADRVSMAVGIVAGAGLLAIVAVHAIKIARANPVKALRYE